MAWRENADITKLKVRDLNVWGTNNIAENGPGDKWYVDSGVGSSGDGKRGLARLSRWPKRLLPLPPPTVTKFMSRKATLKLWQPLGRLPSEQKSEPGLSGWAKGP